MLYDFVIIICDVIWRLIIILFKYVYRFLTLIIYFIYTCFIFVLFLSLNFILLINIKFCFLNTLFVMKMLWIVQADLIGIFLKMAIHILQKLTICIIKIILFGGWTSFSFNDLFFKIIRIESNFLAIIFIVVYLIARMNWVKAINSIFGFILILMYHLNGYIVFLIIFIAFYNFGIIYRV